METQKAPGSTGKTEPLRLHPQLAGPAPYLDLLNQRSGELWVILKRRQEQTAIVGNKVFTTSDGPPLEYGKIPNLKTANAGFWADAIKMLLHSVVQTEIECSFTPAGIRPEISVPMGQAYYRYGRPLERYKRAVVKGLVLCLVEMGWLDLLPAGREPNGQSRNPRIRVKEPFAAWMYGAGLITGHETPRWAAE